MPGISPLIVLYHNGGGCERFPAASGAPGVAANGQAAPEFGFDKVNV